VGALAGGEAGAAPELLAGGGAVAGGAQGHEFSAARACGEILGGGIGIALGDASRGELFGVAAAGDEFLLKANDLLVEQEVCLVDQAKQGIGPHGRVFVVEPWAVEVAAGVVSGGGGIGWIGRIGRIVFMPGDGADRLGLQGAAISESPQGEAISESPVRARTMKSGFLGMGISSADDKERIRSHFMAGDSEIASPCARTMKSGFLGMGISSADDKERIRSHLMAGDSEIAAP